MARLRNLIEDARRRRVFRVAALYIVAAWVVLQVADLAMESVGLPDVALLYVWIALILGFPVAVVFGWRYDLTWSGIVRTPPRDDSQPGDLSLKRADYVTLAALLVVAASVAYWSTQAVLEAPRPATAPVAVAAVHPRSIAVLPFENLSSDDSNAFFAAGVHEDILTRLSKITDLRVRSPKAVSAYADQPVSAVTRELLVAWVVEGSVRRSDNQIRVTAQLVDARTHDQVWAASFDRELDDVFAIQTEVAEEIVSHLEIELTPAEQHLLTHQPTDNIEAYDLLLKARVFANRDYDFDAAQVLLETAIELDPGLVLAYVDLANVHSGAYWLSFDTSPERIEKMKSAVDRALELAPELPEVQIALANYYYYGLQNFDRALVAAQTALERFPNNTEILALIARLQRRLGMWDEALETLDSMRAIDPSNSYIVPRLFTLMTAQRWNQAHGLVNDVSAEELGDNFYPFAIALWGFGDLDAARVALDTWPEASLTSMHTLLQKNWLRVELAVWNRDYETAISIARADLLPDDESDPLYNRNLTDWRVLLAELYVLSGNPEAASDLLIKAEQERHETAAREEQNPLSWDIGFAYASLAEVQALLGKGEDALANCERARRLLPEQREKLESRQNIAQTCALVAARAGATDAALDEIERLVGEPAGFSFAELRLDPRFDLLRDEFRFAAILGRDPRHPATPE